MLEENLATKHPVISQGEKAKTLNSDRRLVLFVGLLSIFILSLFLLVSVTGCSMSEELRRIEKTAAVADKQDASRSSTLTGEQLFIRSCNTCHPGGKAGTGPSFESLSEHFPDDDALKSLIRNGKRHDACSTQIHHHRPRTR